MTKTALSAALRLAINDALMAGPTTLAFSTGNTAPARRVVSGYTSTAVGTMVFALPADVGPDVSRVPFS